MKKNIRNNYFFKIFVVFPSLLFFIIIGQSCNKSKSSEVRSNKDTKSTESQIMEILPSEFFENGFSKAGLLEGDAAIFITKDALNVTYLINGQNIMEKGFPKNLNLTTNRLGRKILRGDWDNQTAGDGVFIVYLKNGVVIIQITGDGWMYKAEKKVDEKLNRKLLKLFYGNENYKEGIEMTDSIMVVFREKINKKIHNKLSKQVEGRKINTDIFFGDIDNDGNQDAFVYYCVEPKDEDLNVGGGNAMMNMKCWESGIVSYLNKGNEFILKQLIDIYKLSDEGIVDFKAEKMENGEMICSYLTYADNDPRCCPSLKHTISLFLKNDVIYKKNIN
jgi:hypothetical protein